MFYMPGIIGDHDKETGGGLHEGYRPSEMAYTKQLIQVQWRLEKGRYKVQWD